jgi:hypothetical protein
VLLYITERPVGLHLETRGTRPQHFKSEGSNLKNSCLCKNANLTRITFEPLFTLTLTLKIKEGRYSNKPTNIPVKQGHYKGKLYRRHKGNTQTQQTENTQSKSAVVRQRRSSPDNGVCGTRAATNDPKQQIGRPKPDHHHAWPEKVERDPHARPMEQSSLARDGHSPCSDTTKTTGGWSRERW